MDRSLEIFGLSALVCFAMGFPVRRFLQRLNIIDKPNARSSHSEVTVRGGGIAILAAVVTGALVATRGAPGLVLTVLLASAVCLGAISFFDDVRPLPPGIRFGSHALAAAAALWALHPRSIVLSIPAGHPLDLLAGIGWLVAFLWLAGYTNAFNFMDGINGIAAGQAVITGVGAGALTGFATGHWTAPPVLLAFALAGAAAGFLPHNFPRARMFMGDVSSAPLGFLLGAVVLWLAAEYGGWLLIPLALLHTNFVLDTAITLVRRLFHGERWYEAHREHFYQRLIRSGKTHSFVTGTEMGLQGVVLGMLMFYESSDMNARLLLSIAVLGVWLLFFGYCEYRFRRWQLAQPAEAIPAAVQNG